MAPLEAVRVLVVGALVLPELGSERVEVLRAVGAEAALDAVDAEGVELVVVDLDSLGAVAAGLLPLTRERWPELPVFLVSSSATGEECARHLAAGATDVIAAEPQELRLGLRKALLQIERCRDRPATLPGGGNTVLGRSAIMQRLAEVLERVAPTPATVLLRGESGTGKELVARALHGASLVADQALIKIDCTSLPDNLLESELFGYEKGAFTGAVARKPGRVELAHGGTLFLDEVGELPLSTQAKLLRLLQDREFERLGGTKTLRVDIRLIAATHRDLENMAERGLFRRDLFYRLNVVPVWLPPLRARRDDIEALALHFLAQSAVRNGRRELRLSTDAVQLLSQQRWPGNVRQLQNFMERLSVLASGPAIDASTVRRELDRPVVFETEVSSRREPRPGANVLDGNPEGALAERSEPARETVHLSQVMRDAERQALVDALAQVGGNRSTAARMLGISRSTFYAKLREYQLQ